MPMPGAPGTLSTRVAAQRLHVDHLLRRHPELLHHLRHADADVLHGVQHRHLRSPTSCIRSLSEETITTSPPASRTWQA